MLPFKVPRLREVIFGIRPGVLVQEFATQHIHLTPLLLPTPDSIPSRSTAMPYCQYHGVMLAQSQTRHPSSSRAGIPRQLTEERNCQKRLQVMELDGKYAAGLRDGVVRLYLLTGPNANATHHITNLAAFTTTVLR